MEKSFSAHESCLPARVAVQSEFDLARARTGTGSMAAPVIAVRHSSNAAQLFAAKRKIHHRGRSRIAHSFAAVGELGPPFVPFFATKPGIVSQSHRVLCRHRSAY